MIVVECTLVIDTVLSSSVPYQSITLACNINMSSVHEVEQDLVIQVHTCHTVCEGLMSSYRREKPQRNKGCISDNKRTSSCRTTRRNLGTSARRSKSRQARGGLDDETMDMDAHDKDGRDKDDEVNDGCGEDDEVNNGRGKDDEINDGCGEDDEVKYSCGEDGEVKYGCGEDDEVNNGCGEDDKVDNCCGEDDKVDNGCGEDDEVNKGCGGDDEGKNGCGDGGDSDSDNDDDNTGYDGPCLPNRPKRKFLPSQTQVMALLSMAVPPEDRGAFEDRFRSFKTGEVKPTCPSTGTVYRTSAAHIAGAYGCDIALPLHSAADMFPSSGMMSSYLSEIYVMDVILNRSPFSEEAVGKSVNKAAGCDDDVLLVRSYHEEDLHDDNDYKFRTMILFLPQCGVFCCARERRHEDVEVARMLVALDMSWLRLQRRYYREEGKIVYTFGGGGYVKQFY